LQLSHLLGHVLVSHQQSWETGNSTSTSISFETGTWHFANIGLPTRHHPKQLTEDIEGRMHITPGSHELGRLLTGAGLEECVHSPAQFVG
jgi:hypothetical protein